MAYLRSALGEHRAALFWCFDSTKPREASHFPANRYTEGVNGSSYVAAFTEGQLTAWDGDNKRIEAIKREAAIMVDSDIAIAMRKVLVEGKRDPERVGIVLDLAKKSAEWRASVQVYPALRQALLTSNLESQAQTVEQTIESLLRLQALDINASQTSDTIQYDSAILSKMERHFSANGYDGCAKRWLAQLRELGEPPLWGDVIATYAVILKLVHLGVAHRKKTVAAKLAIFDDFLRTRLIQAQPRFFVLGRLFFKGRLSGLLKASPGDRAYNPRRLLGGVWDIYQTTIHEGLLATSAPPTGLCSILCTRDQALAEYAGHFPLRGAMVVDDGSIRLQHDWDDPWLIELLGEPLWSEVVGAANATDPLREHMIGDPERLVEAVLEMQDELGFADGAGLLSRANPKRVVWAKKIDEGPRPESGDAKSQERFMPSVSQPREAVVLTVTFDTNTLAAVVQPETAQRENAVNATIVRDAVRSGRIRGYFCETVVTVEGIENKDRWKFLGKSRIISEASVVGTCQPGSPVNFQFGVGSEHKRPPLSPEVAERVRAALDLGMLPLRSAARFDSYHLDPVAYQSYEPDGGTSELIRCMECVNELSTEIERRGLGRSKAVELGKEFTKRDAVAEPELWLVGLGRARTKSEQNKVAEVAAEWADGDSIAAHCGFGMQLFCSEDFGKSGSGSSVLDPDNRKWLHEEFDIEFATLSELARMVER